MIAELDLVVLTKDIDKHGLKSGDVGTVVGCWGDGKAFEIEFITSDGETIAVLTLERDEVRPREGAEILHVRPLDRAA